MQSLRQCVVQAMDGSDERLFDFFPYIFQDLWELGTSPKIAIELIRKHCSSDYPNLALLDLGCGKGAVSVLAAKELGCRCLGIEAIVEFVEEAKQRAEEHGVAGLCEFRSGDIRKEVKKLKSFDIALLGSVGPVLGGWDTMLQALLGVVKPNGIIVIDEGYIEDRSKFRHPLVEKRSTVMRRIEKSGMRLLDEFIIGKEEIKRSNDYIVSIIKKRCFELAESCPGQAALFIDYIKRQEEENKALENEITCVTIVFRT